MASYRSSMNGQNEHTVLAFSELQPGAAGRLSLCAEGEPVSLTPRLAILPFENLSQDPDKAFYSDGLHEEILTTLATRAYALEIISRTTMMSYRCDPKPLMDVVSELHATHVLEGTVRREGDQVQLNLELIDGQTGKHFWSQRYDRTLSTALTLQTEVAREVAGQLMVKLVGGTRESKPPTEGIEAYDCYLRALAARCEGRYVDAQSFLDRATGYDPAFAQAYAIKAFEYATLINSGVATPQDPTQRAALASLLQENVDRALALDANLGIAYTALAAIHQYNWRWLEALQAQERAVQLSPNDPFVVGICAYTLARIGSEDNEAIAWRMAQHTADLDPRSPTAYGLKGVTALFLGRYDDAAVALNKALQLDPRSAAGFTHVVLGWVEARRGNTNAALEAIRMAELVSMDTPSPSWLARLIYAYGRAGSHDDAMRLFTQLRSQAESGPVSAMSWFMAYLGIGEIKQALDWLHQGIDAGDTYGWVMTLLAKRRTFAFLWENRRFQDARRKVGFVD
jgi:adenylate cyclase